MRSLTLKLVLAFLTVSLTATVLAVSLGGWSTSRAFGHFMSGQNQEVMVARLADHYRARSGWRDVENVMPMRGMHGMRDGRGVPPPGEWALADATGRVVVAGAGYQASQLLLQPELESGTAIWVDSELVGFLMEGQTAFAMMPPAGTEYLAQVNRALILAALGATVVALLLGTLLAGALTRPLRELTAATRAVAAGDFARRVRVRSQDELGELASAFNQMAADLARAQELRREMTADIAHELRTPLSVILGHAEALRDGVLPPTGETLALVHDEAQRLNRLVEDLRTLSLVEAGELSLVCRPTSPHSLLERAIALQSPRARQKNVTLQIKVERDLPELEVDPDRIAQVLYNLVDNALRHTPEGGIVTLAACLSPLAKDPQGVQLSVADSGPGIAPDDLPRVFERFYRADKSRRRDQSGSGLGLAIAKSLVEAHDGRIGVESSPGRGARFVIELPISKIPFIAEADWRS